jgi:hypothetical protein
MYVFIYTHIFIFIHTNIYSDQCQKSLNEYLDQKKKIFPRFYFVSNVALLDMLANGNYMYVYIYIYLYIFIYISIHIYS